MMHGVELIGDRCTQPGCTGQILDGYCDVCGMAATVPPATAGRAGAAAGGRRCARPAACLDAHVDELPPRLGAARLAAGRRQPPHRAPRRAPHGVDQPRRRADVGAAGARHRPDGRR